MRNNEHAPAQIPRVGKVTEVRFIQIGPSSPWAVEIPDLGSCQSRRLHEVFSPRCRYLFLPPLPVATVNEHRLPYWRTDHLDGGHPLGCGLGNTLCRNRNIKSHTTCEKEWGTSL